MKYYRFNSKILRIQEISRYLSQLFLKKRRTNIEFQGSDISARGAEKEPRRGDLSPDRGGRSRAAASIIKSQQNFCISFQRVHRSNEQVGPNLSYTCKLCLCTLFIKLAKMSLVRGKLNKARFDKVHENIIEMLTKSRYQVHTRGNWSF